MAKQKRVLDDLVGHYKDKEKHEQMAKNKETLKSAGSKKPKKKKTTSKKKKKQTDEDEAQGLYQTDEDDGDGIHQVDEDEAETLKIAGSKKPKTKTTSKKKKLEKPDEDEAKGQDQTNEDEGEGLKPCVIISHKTDKQRLVKVLVKWKDKFKGEWQYLYDMWADYPTEVIKYQNNNKNKCRGKIWKIPKIEGVKYFVRILGMVGGDDKVTEAQFIVLANNGYKFDGKESVKYNELKRDDPELLTDYLDSIKVSSETDDATKLSVSA